MWKARSALVQKKFKMSTCVVVLSYLEMLKDCTLNYTISH